VRVEFFQPSEKRRICAWDAYRGKRTVVPGSHMAAGAGLPHDLAQYVIEASTGYAHGFWGLLARGATFKSTRRKRTKPGRAVIAEHRAELINSEVLAGRHLGEWHAGVATTVTQALDAALDQWRQLAVGDRLVFEWPSPRGRMVQRA
jgi:hypothetical protein